MHMILDVYHRAMLKLKPIKSGFNEHSVLSEGERET